MNSDQLQANWEKVKGKVRKQWGKLTDNDMSQMEGSQEQLLGKLMEYYGYSKEKAEEALNKFLKGFDDSGEVVHSIIDTAADKISDAASKVADMATNCQDFAKKKPLTTIGLLFAAGLAMGFLIAK